MNDTAHAAKLEGVLFALGKSLAKKELQSLLNIDEASLARAVALCQGGERGVVVVDDGTELELRAAPAVAALIESIRREEASRDLGRAGLEVLAAILYRGPLSRADIDFIRGVNSSQTVRTLTMRGLVRRVANPKDERSYLYEPTTELLATLGITHTRDVLDFDLVKEKLLTLETNYRQSQEASS